MRINSPNKTHLSVLNCALGGLGMREPVLLHFIFNSLVQNHDKVKWKEIS